MINSDVFSPPPAVNSIFSEKIQRLKDLITHYETEILRHPLATTIQEKKLSPRDEEAFAMYLFMDSWMWPSMLITMQDHVCHPQLKIAIEDNLRDEAGKHGISHIKLCIDFVKSLGFFPKLINTPELNRTINIACELTEPQIAGWLTGAEMMTLPLYELALACFGDRPRADLRYLKVHMHVDEDHIRWLWEAMTALLEDNLENESKIREGISLGARATLRALDEIYEEAVRN